MKFNIYLKINLTQFEQIMMTIFDFIDNLNVNVSLRLCGDPGAWFQ